MSTISKLIAHDIIFTDKYAEDNAAKIVTYRNQFDGGLSFAVVFERDHFLKYELSPACDDVKTVWISPEYSKHTSKSSQAQSNKKGLTPYGQSLFLDSVVTSL